MPFPLIQSREKWLDQTLPVTAGTLTARIVVPEIDGAMTPLCISTQDAGKDGFMVDSIAVSAIQYGNILLFPQPRPALGDDEFKLVHGVQVAPPHSYLAPYFYMQKGFNADVLIHFGTHGNLEFTPGKNVGLSQADWAEVLIGNRPHLYFYTTGNVGEGIIAKRRTHAVLVTYLTPPYVESGMRQKYSSLLENIHRAIADPSNNTVSLKNEIISLGLHSDLKLDSTTSGTYSMEELELVDNFVEELANEKITGAYYVLGTPYSKENITTTIEAIAADKIAYQRAKILSWGIFSFCFTLWQSGNRFKGIGGVSISTALLLCMLESFIMVSVCLISTRSEKQLSWKEKIGFYYPGFSIAFPIMAFSGYQLKAYPGISFDITGVLTAAVIMTSMAVILLLVKKILNDTNERLNCLYLLNISIITIIIIIYGIQ